MSTKLFDLTGKNALVTGGTHGIGMAIVVGLRLCQGRSEIAHPKHGHRVGQAQRPD
jgi:NAD(P)-dependent dehydrogenase (short-subunit alcohol dehydrogenase family)